MLTAADKMQEKNSQVSQGHIWLMLVHTGALYVAFLHTSHTPQFKPSHHFFLSETISMSLLALLSLPESHPISIYMNLIYS